MPNSKPDNHTPCDRTGPIKVRFPAPLDRAIRRAALESDETLTAWLARAARMMLKEGDEI